MVSRRIRSTIIVSVAAFALAALPAAALADPTTEVLSAVDAIATDVAVDGKVNDSKPSTTTASKDSPTVSTYGGGTEIVPPPVDCSAKGTGSGPSTDAGGDGKPADGKPSEGKPSETTKPCAEKSVEKPVEKPEETPVVTEPVVETCVEGGGNPDAAVGTTVCGGGGPEEIPAELPIEEPEVVSGGGEAPTPVVAGGGGPELPFTGLPLSSAVWGGLILMVIGGVMWFRGRSGHQPG